MRIQVDRDACDAHGQCAFAAPEVFELDESGDLRYAPDPDDVLRPRVETAARLCPVQAIEILT